MTTTTQIKQFYRQAERGDLKALGDALDDMADGTLVYDVLDATTLKVGSVAVTATAAELNKLDDSAAVMTAGSGIAGIETYATGVFREGDVIYTRMVVDLTGLVVDNADLDIIGDDDAANCHFGQITAALNGTIVGGKMTCLEVPVGAGTVVDIDLYSATEGTGTEGVASGVGSLTETALVTSGASWTSGRTLGMTALPAANEYLYLAAGAAGGDSSAFTAGKFLIEFYGTA